MELMSSEAVILSSGALAFATLVASPLMQTRSKILVLQFGATIFFAIHYAAMGVLAACAVNLICSIQTAAAIVAPDSRRISFIGWAMIPVLLATAIVFWAGPVSILSSLATVAIAVGRMQVDEVRLRSLVLLGGVFWIAHDFIVESWIALSADIFCAAFGAYMLLRLTKENLPAVANKVQLAA